MPNREYSIPLNIIYLSTIVHVVTYVDMVVLTMRNAIVTRVWIACCVGTVEIQIAKYKSLAENYK